MPSRGIACATSCICEAFSSIVMRETRSFTRWSTGRLGSKYGGRAEEPDVATFAADCAANGEAFNSRKKDRKKAMAQRQRPSIRQSVLGMQIVLGNMMPRFS